MGQERRRRFLGREGQKHPLVCVLYTREKGKVTSIVSLSLDYVIFDEDGRASTIIPVVPRGKRGNKRGTVVDIKDYAKVKLTRLQRELLTIKFVADFGEDAWLNSQ